MAATTAVEDGYASELKINAGAVEGTDSFDGLPSDGQLGGGRRKFEDTKGDTSRDNAGFLDKNEVERSALRRRFEEAIRVGNANGFMQG